MAVPISLTDLASLQNDNTVISSINSNNNAITTAFQDALSLTGMSPNQMQSSLDMNSKQIINLPAPATSNSPLRLADLNSFVGGGTVSNIPAGGTSGQALTKNSNSDYDTHWATVAGGGLSAGTNLQIISNVVSTLASVAFTTVNKYTLTTPATGATLTIADGKTFTVNNNLTLAGTDNQTYTFPSSGNVAVLNNNITIGSLNAVSAWNLLGNNTGSSASPAAFTIDSLTNKPSPALADEVLLWDVGASQMKKAPVSGISSAGSVGSVNGQTGTIVIYGQPGGRLTLTTLTPVLTSTVTAATTVYYTPCRNNFILIYDGTNFVPTTVAEISQATTDATKSPAAVGANSNYDIFVWNDAGTIRATRGPAWSSNTVRGTGAGTTELQQINGMWLNKVAITNGPGANRGTYVGTIRSNGTSTIDYNLGGAGGGGVAAVIGVWNMYNRHTVKANVSDNTASWTYLAGVTRPLNNSTGNRISTVVGFSEDAGFYSLSARSLMANAAGGYMIFGLGLNSTTVMNSLLYSSATTVGIGQAVTAVYAEFPGLGFNFVQALEQGDGTFSNTNGGPTYFEAILQA